MDPVKIFPLQFTGVYPHYDTKWFSLSESSFMINYRVDNTDEMLEHLKGNGRAVGTDALGRKE